MDPKELKELVESMTQEELRRATERMKKAVEEMLRLEKEWMEASLTFEQATCKVPQRDNN